jgi:hypothetical protein
LALRSLKELRASPRALARGLEKRAVLTGSNAAAEAIVTEERRSEDEVDDGREASRGLIDDNDAHGQAVVVIVPTIELVKNKEVV